MGSCNSTVRDLETAGVFVGAAGLSVAEPELAPAAVIGAGAVAAKIQHTNCNKKKTGLINAVNSIVTSAIIQSTINCSDTNQLLQNITITCNPQDEKGNHFVYEANQACNECIENVFRGAEDHIQLERETWGNAKVKVRQPIDNQYQLLLTRIEGCGLQLCKACTFVNATQSNFIGNPSSQGTVRIKCLLKMDNYDAFKTNFQTLLKGQLLQNQDVMSTALKLFKNPNLDSFAINVSNQISENTHRNLVSQIRSNLSQTQLISISTGVSTEEGNFTQNSFYQVASQVVSDNDIATKIFGSDALDAIEKEVQKQNTLNDVGQVVFQTTMTFADTLDSVIGKIMLATIVALGLLLILVTGYIFYEFVKGFEKDLAQKRKANELRTI